MLYKNLHNLIENSNSSRGYFLSLPISTQVTLHEQNDYIHSAAELRQSVSNIEKYNHAVKISKTLC